MKFKQNLSLLLWLYRGKASKDGKAPIYLRITIDGLDTDISLGQKIHLISGTERPSKLGVQDWNRK